MGTFECDVCGSATGNVNAGTGSLSGRKVCRVCIGTTIGLQIGRQNGLSVDTNGLMIMLAQVANLILDRLDEVERAVDLSDGGGA